MAATVKLSVNDGCTRVTLSGLDYPLFTMNVALKDL